MCIIRMKSFIHFTKTTKLLVWAATLMQLHHPGTDVCDIFDPNLFFFYVFALTELSFFYKCFSLVKTPTLVSWSTECSLYAQQRFTFNNSWIRQHLVWGLRFRFGVGPINLFLLLLWIKCKTRDLLWQSELLAFFEAITDQRGCKLSSKTHQRRTSFPFKALWTYVSSNHKLLIWSLLKELY